MGPLSYMRSVVDRNVVMRRIPLFRSTILLCSNSHLYRLSSYQPTHLGGGGLGGRSPDHGSPGSVPAYFMFILEEYNVAPGEASLQVRPSVPTNAIHPKIHTHLFITDVMWSWTVFLNSSLRHTKVLVAKPVLPSASVMCRTVCLFNITGRIPDNVVVVCLPGVTTHCGCIFTAR
jgi:hypothetical protein